MAFADRRQFLVAAAAGAGLAAVEQLVPLRAQTATAATLTLGEESGFTVPPNFIGFSYEIEQLSDPSFFSASNTGLIEQFRKLSPGGVLRLGGNTSDVGWWKATPASTQPPLPSNVVSSVEPNTRPFQELAYAVTPEAVRNLRAFLDATNWTCLYGINLGTNTPERGAEEAVAVARILGTRLEYFQLGNEPDLFQRRFRDPKTWGVDPYLDEWLAMADAIRARVPAARFGLPDTSGSPTWSSRISERLSELKPGTGHGTRPTIAAVTHHYYFGGPPSNPNINLDRLLQADPRVAAVAETTKEAAHRLDVPYRMSEGNTCYQGGKPGVSDVLGAALWACDYALFLASNGYAGINLHGGGGKAVGNSLGGRLPGEALIPAGDTTHPRPFYTPIAAMNGGYTAEPDFYGLLFAGQFAGAKILGVHFDPGTANATAYAARLRSGARTVVIVNKDGSNALPLLLPGFYPKSRLTAPSLTAREAHIEQLSQPGEITSVPPATAVLLVERS